MSADRDQLIRQLLIDDLKRHDSDPRYAGMTHQTKPARDQESEAPADQSVLATYGLKKPESQVLPISVDPEAHSAADRKYDAAQSQDNAEGVLRGASNTARRFLNALPGNAGIDWANDANTRKALEESRAFPETAKFLGENIALAPISAAGRGGMALVDRALPEMAGGSVLRSALRGGAKTAVSGTEGAGLGAATSGPDDHGTGMSLGAAMSMFPRLAAVIGKRGAEGLVRKSSDAMRLESEVPGLQLPLASAADDSGLSGVVKSVYRGGLPNLPGASAALQRQHEEAADTVRRYLSERATAPGLVADLSGSPAEQIDNLRDAFNRHYMDAVNSYKFNIPSDIEDQVKARVAASVTPQELAAGNAVPGHVQEKIGSLISGELQRMAGEDGTVGGRNLMWAKTNASALRDDPRAISNAYERTKLPHGVGAIDDMVQDQLPATDAAKYEAGKRPYALFTRLQEATDKANKNKGRYTFGQLKDSVGTYAPEGPQDVDLSHIADLGIDVLDKNKPNPNWGGRFAMTSLGGGALLASGPTGLGSALGASYALTPMGVQKALMGNTDWQKALVSKLRANPRLVRDLGSSGRQMLVAGENDDGT